MKLDLKLDYKELYSKALKGGAEMLEHAYKLDKAADENPDTVEAVRQRLLACILRDYYTKMFN